MNFNNIVATYAAYHSDVVLVISLWLVLISWLVGRSRNKIIHIIFVPTIYFGGVCLLQAIPIKWTPCEDCQYLSIDASTLFTYVPLLFLLSLNRIEVYICALVLTSELLLAKYLYFQSIAAGTTSQFLLIAGVIHVVGWIAQFIGHGVFESTFLLFSQKLNEAERKPALMDNILLLFAAPLFVVGEVALSFSVSLSGEGVWLKRSCGTSDMTRKRGISSGKKPGKRKKSI